MAEADGEPKPSKRTSAKGRQDGDYSPPILAEPKGGPIPTYRPPAEPAAKPEAKPKG